MQHCACGKSLQPWVVAVLVGGNTTVMNIKTARKQGYKNGEATHYAASTYDIMMERSGQSPDHDVIARGELTRGACRGH